MSAPVYIPSKWQEEFHRLPHHEALGAGSAGPGKTETLLHDADGQIVTEHRRWLEARERGEHYQSTGWALHLRRTMPMLRQTIVRSRRVFPLIDENVKWVAQEYTWEFTSGYRYQFGHCNDLDDWDQYMSAEYTWIGFDELTQFTEEQYDQIITRLRSTDPELSKMLRVRSMSNPVMRRAQNENFNVLDPYWVRRRFVEPHPDGRKTLKRKLVRQDGRVEWRTYIYLPAKLHDNPNKAFVEQYELSLLNSPPHIRRALLDGDWFLTEGSYFGAVWNKQMHVCQPFKIPAEWSVFRSMDWGFKSHGCVHWWAYDGDGTWYVFRELTFQEKTADQVADAIREIEGPLGLWNGDWEQGRGKSKITGPADTQLWEKRGDKGLSKAEEFQRKGVMWTRADKNSKNSGRQRNAERVSKMLGAHENGTRTPELVFFSTCGNIIRTLPGIQTDPNNPEEPLKGGEDHWYDSIAYGAAHASRGGSFVGPPRSDDDDDDEKEEVSAQQRGRYGYGSSVC